MSARTRAARSGQPKRSPPELLPMYKAPAKPASAHGVGRYALQFNWQDGHSGGIYSWEYLRRNCQCRSLNCRRRGRGHAQLGCVLPVVSRRGTDGHPWGVSVSFGLSAARSLASNSSSLAIQFRELLAFSLAHIEEADADAVALCRDCVTQASRKGRPSSWNSISARL